MDRTVGIIGVGVMGSAILKGIVKSDLLPGNKIYCFDTSDQKLADAKVNFGINTVKSNEELVEKSDIIILAVKPYLIKDVLFSLKKLLTSDKVIVSIAAGVPISLCESVLGAEWKIVRAMPNIPLQVGEGMTLICCNNNVTEKDKRDVVELFKCAGQAEELPESLMDEVVALTSSSPAYIFMMIEAMSDAAVQSGIPRDLSYKLAAQAVLGSARMVLETGKHPGALKDQVCTPAGTTIEAVMMLEKYGFRNAVMEAMKACTKKSREMSNRNE